MPTAKNSAVMLRPEAPTALRIPISLRFSATSRTRWPMIANAATSTMIVTTTKSAYFSSWSAANRLRFMSIQSRTQNGNPSVPATARPTRLASNGSSSLTSMPVTPASPANSCAAGSARYAIEASNSYIPISTPPPPPAGAAPPPPPPPRGGGGGGGEPPPAPPPPAPPGGGGGGGGGAGAD